MSEVLITKGARWAGFGLLILVLIVGGGNLWATYALNGSTKAAEHRQQTAQRHQGELIEHKLCTTLAKLAARKPPSGSPGANPSRAYLQWQHDQLAELGPDIGCGHTTGGTR